MRATPTASALRPSHRPLPNPTPLSSSPTSTLSVGSRPPCPPRPTSRPCQGDAVRTVPLSHPQPFALCCPPVFTNTLL
eukprot:24785-Rhodomonas_salina.3